MDRRHIRQLSGLGVLAGCCVLAACGSGDGFIGGTSGGPLQPTFGSIQDNVFTPICEQCHSGAAAPRGLRLDEANSYAMLVGVPSDEEPGILRVRPSDPANSYLIQKLEGTASTGERMPAGLPALPQSTIDVIRQWITNGAQPDTAPSTGAIRVTSLTPIPGTTISSLPASITAAFDRELNATTVDVTTFRLERSGGDQVFGNGNDVAIAPSSVVVPSANPRSAVMNLAGGVSASDLYRVTLSGSSPVAILDLSGNALDGEFGTTFPSGNGTAGGDFIARFTVGGLQPTLQSIQDNVFGPICSSCHTGNGSTLPGSMNLSNVNSSRAALVGVASVQVPAMQRVQPGNANNSYLIRKLEGTSGIVGNRMPLGLPPLDQGSIDVIRQWITSGAM